MTNIIRQPYLDKIEQAFGKDIIIVLTGQRRIGKSYLLRQLREQKAQDPSNNVIFVDKEKKEYDDIRDYRDLNRYIDEHRVAGKVNYILIDEIQDIAEFERTVRSYREEPDTEIVITGSNSMMLSGEMATLIGGRYREIYVQALSYEEFLTFHGLTDGDDSLALYINFGGLPGLQKTGLDENDVREYQQDVLSTVLLKDVIMRNKIRNPVFLENLTSFLADNTGKIISANRPPSIDTLACRSLAPVPSSPGTFSVRMKSNRLPIKAPITWNSIYIPQSLPLIRPARKQPSVIAGLI